LQFSELIETLWFIIHGHSYPFSFGHWIIYPSSIYDFWDYPIGIFKLFCGHLWN